MTACDYPHTLLDSMNDQIESDINIRPYTEEIQSMLCLQYHHDLESGLSETAARDSLEELIESEVKRYALTAHLTIKHLIALREENLAPQGEEFDEFYQDYDRKKKLEAEGRPEGLTCKHGAVCSTGVPVGLPVSSDS